MAVTIKGFYLKGVVEYVRKKLGPDGLIKLEERYGKNINFSAFKDYPMEEDALLKKAAVEVLSKDNKEAGHFEVGKLAFKIYTDTAVGKTMLALLGKNPKTLAHSLSKVIDTVTAGLKAKVKDIDESAVKITMTESPYNIRHYEGIFFAALEYLDYNPKIKTRVLENGDHEYTVNWEN